MYHKIWRVRLSGYAEERPGPPPPRCLAGQRAQHVLGGRLLLLGRVRPDTTVAASPCLAALGSAPMTSSAADRCSCGVASPCTRAVPPRRPAAGYPGRRLCLAHLAESLTSSFLLSTVISRRTHVAARRAGAGWLAPRAGARRRSPAGAARPEDRADAGMAWPRPGPAGRPPPPARSRCRCATSARREPGHDGPEERRAAPHLAMPKNRRTWPTYGATWQV